MQWKRSLLQLLLEFLSYYLSPSRRKQSPTSSERAAAAPNPNAPLPNMNEGSSTAEQALEKPDLLEQLRPELLDAPYWYDRPDLNQQVVPSSPKKEG